VPTVTVDRERRRSTSGQLRACDDRLQKEHELVDHARLPVGEFSSRARPGIPLTRLRLVLVLGVFECGLEPTNEPPA
jgi:hypothetical protein